MVKLETDKGISRQLNEFSLGDYACTGEEEFPRDKIPNNFSFKRKNILIGKNIFKASKTETLQLSRNLPTIFVLLTFSLNYVI